MARTTAKFDAEPVLHGLKEFQRNTADFVFKRLYQDDPPAHRFLLADEVGLGKTVVAAGVIARAIEHLQKAPGRIDILYICSNLDIARQNIRRLNVTGDRSVEMASRITLLPLVLDQLTGQKVNFISFTPSTSFDLQGGTGVAQERALIFKMLAEEWGLKRSDSGTLNLLRATSEKGNFAASVDRLWNTPINPQITKLFLREVQRQKLKVRFDALHADFRRVRKNVPADLNRKRNQLISDLRGLLAQACLKALQPKLIILDEFQRFKHLLDPQSAPGQLAGDLFEYVGRQSKNSAARVLLLSATPYKMYTVSHESATDDHYADFRNTLQFLHNDPKSFAATENLLRDYRRELTHLSDVGSSQLQRIKGALEDQLRQVMVRTERLAASSDRNGMLREVTTAPPLLARDLEDYLSLQQLAKSVGHPDVMEYWKSAPYLLNFMLSSDYDFKRKSEEALDTRNAAALDALQAAPDMLLQRSSMEQHEPLEPANARLRALMHDVLDPGWWRLLWLPPSFPYYQPMGAFAQPQAEQATKRLIFSSWRMVPRVIATLLSYEVERRIREEAESKGQDKLPNRASHSPLLRFAVAKEQRKGKAVEATGSAAAATASTGGRETGMPVLGLIYPCSTLARVGDPLAALATLRNAGGVPSLSKVRSHVRKQVVELLRPLTAGHAKRPGATDDSWYWAAPLLLDAQLKAPHSQNWFAQSDLPTRWLGSTSEVEEYSYRAAHVERARRVLSDPTVLGRPPKDLADVLTLVALAAPGVAALRALSRVTGGLDVTPEVGLSQRNGAAQVALGFVHLFNQAEATAVVRAAAGDAPGQGASSQAYWRQVLNYCLGGNLQSVLDEYGHTLRESQCAPQEEAQAVAGKVALSMQEAVTLRVSSLSVDSLIQDAKRACFAFERHENNRSQWQLRAHFALHFGIEQSNRESTATGGEYTRPSQVKDAFNSPFWPFVLATTSVGQEGLDFHTYCHAVVHWNLPANPVDMEQREGRVHRFKGHAVRKNVAAAGSEQLKALGSTEDPWAHLFELAKETCAPQAMGLEPYWTFCASGDKGAFIERHVPILPLSREHDRLQRLRESLAIYRMVFGQARQEDLLRYLALDLPDQQVADLCASVCISLEPPSK